MLNMERISIVKQEYLIFSPVLRTLENIPKSSLTRDINSIGISIEYSPCDHAWKRCNIGVKYIAKTKKRHFCMEVSVVHLNNGLFFFERCSLKNATVCGYKLNNARYENLFAHIVAVIRLHLSKKNNSLLKYLHF